MKYSRPEIIANATQHFVSSYVLQTFHFMYLDDYLTKLWFSAKKELVKNKKKIPHPLNPKVQELICNIFFVRGTECQVLNLFKPSSKIL